MKKLNLKLAGVITFSLLSFSTFAQDWLVGGNTLLQMGGNPPILGTMAGNNQPLNIYTNGVQRGIRNGDRTPTINGFNVNTSGFMGIGPNSIGNGHPDGLWTDIGPFSLLHLNGVIPN